MIRFVAMEIIVGVLIILVWFVLVKYTRKPMKKLIDEIVTEYNKPDDTGETKKEETKEEDKHV